MRKPELLLSCVLPLALMVPGAALAQAEAPPQAAAPVEETDIIVTAQFRSQRLQDTPLSVTALGAQQLEERGLTRITDITNSAPNVVMKPSPGSFGPAATLFIRGVGQTDSSFAADPGVGIYVDDVYRGITFGSMLDLLDLDRVEILRGPQGTLAGKNSIGGAVKLYTRAPDGDTDGYLEVTGGSFDRIDAKGAANLTLVPDTLFARVSAVTRHRDGYVKRLDYNCANPTGPRAPTSTATGPDCVAGREGGQDYTAARLALRWIASDAVEVNLTGSRLVDDSEPPATKLISLGAAAANTPGFPDRSVFLTGPKSYTNYSSYQVQPFTDPPALLGLPGTGTHPATVIPTNNRIRAWDVAGTIDVKLGETLSLKSITAYQVTDGRYSSDTDVSPFGISNAYFFMKYKQFTQELRLNGSIGKTLDYTVGGFYFDGQGRLAGSNFVQPGLPAETVNASRDYIPSTSKSVFAHGVVHLTERFNLTGGIRYTRDRKDYNFRRLNMFAPGQPAYTAAVKIDGLKAGFKGDRWDFRINADYKLTDDILA